jgi:hypothetical protein
VKHPGPPSPLVLEVLRDRRTLWASCDAVLGWCLDARRNHPEARAWTAKGTSSALQSLTRRGLLERGPTRWDPTWRRAAPTYRLKAARSAAQVGATARLEVIERLLPLFESAAAAEIHAALLAQRVDLQLRALGGPES